MFTCLNIGLISDILKLLGKPDVKMHWLNKKFNFIILLNTRIIAALSPTIVRVLWSSGIVTFVEVRVSVSFISVPP